MGNKGFGIDQERLMEYAKEIKNTYMTHRWQL